MEIPVGPNYINYIEDKQKEVKSSYLYNISRLIDFYDKGLYHRYVGYIKDLDEKDNDKSEVDLSIYSHNNKFIENNSDYVLMKTEDNKLFKFCTKQYYDKNKDIYDKLQEDLWIGKGSPLVA